MTGGASYVIKDDPQLVFMYAKTLDLVSKLGGRRESETLLKDEYTFGAWWYQLPVIGKVMIPMPYFIGARGRADRQEAYEAIWHRCEELETVYDLGVRAGIRSVVE